MPKRRRPSDPAAIERAREERAFRAQVDEHARRANPARWEDEKLTEARRAELEGKGVVVATDFRGRLKHAHVADVWATMHDRGSLSRDAYNAVRHLQELMIVRAGFERAGEFAKEKTEATGDIPAITARMIDAGIEVDFTLKRVGPPLSRLLAALLDPNAERRDMRVDVLRCTALKGRKRCEAISPGDAGHCKECGREFARIADEIAGATREQIVQPEDWRSIVARVCRITNPASQGTTLVLAAQTLLELRDEVADYMGAVGRHRGKAVEPLQGLRA